MQTPDKKRRKEIKDKLKEEEWKQWAIQQAEIDKKIAAMLAEMELKNMHSSDRMTCDAMFAKLESMLKKKEIKLLSGSFNQYGESVEFIHIESKQAWKFCYANNERSGYCDLNLIR